MIDIVLAIDIGGTNTKFGWVTREGKILTRENIKTKEYPIFEDLVAQIRSLSEEFLKKEVFTYRAMAIGIGAPNGNFYNGNIEFAPNLDWTGVVPVTDIVTRVFGLPSYLTNDANAAAYGEMIFGGAKGMKDFVVITLGTGLGSGFVVNGSLVYGHDGFAGELGHVTVVPEGRMCGCGRKGCLETYASAGGIQVTVEEMLDEFPDTASVLRDHRSDFTAKDVTVAAQQNDPIALKAFEALARMLGTKLADVVAITSPQAIFLFGGLAQAGDLLLVPVKKHMEQNLLKIFNNKVAILPSQLSGADAALMGAAAIAWSELSR